MTVHHLERKGSCTEPSAIWIPQTTDAHAMPYLQTRQVHYPTLGPPTRHACCHLPSFKRTSLNHQKEWDNIRSRWGIYRWDGRARQCFVRKAVRLSVRGGGGGEDHSDTSCDCVSRVPTVLGPCQRPEETFRDEAVVVLPVSSLRRYICSKYPSFLQLPPEPQPLSC